MRNVVAKKLRKIAASLALNPETGYLPAGKLRRKRPYLDEDVVLQRGPPIPRPFVLRECFRRAYREAKKIYKGKPLSSLVPEAEEQKAFASKVVDSVRQYAQD